MWNSKGPNSQPCNINWLPPRAAWTFPLQWKMNLSETKAQTTHAMRQCHYSHPYRLFSEIIKNHISMILISTFPNPGLWYKKVYLELPPPPGILVSWIWEEKNPCELKTSQAGVVGVTWLLSWLVYPTLPFLTPALVEEREELGHWLHQVVSGEFCLRSSEIIDIGR